MRKLDRCKQCFSLFFLLVRVFSQMVYGVWKVGKMPRPIVSIFGSARFPLDDPYAKQAHRLAKMFIEEDVSVLTGGGPGIMEAASCGAIAIPAKGNEIRSMGIGVTALGEGKNPCVQEYFSVNHFFARKWLLTHYSEGFVIFPGGFGTLDEMAEILTLIQTKQLARVPIVLIGTEYWAPFMRWIKGEALQHGSISKDDVALFSVSDDLYEATCIVVKVCEFNGKLNHKKE